MSMYQRIKRAIQAHPEMRNRDIAAMRDVDPQHVNNCRWELKDPARTAAIRRRCAAEYEARFQNKSVRPIDRRQVLQLRAEGVRPVDIAANLGVSRGVVAGIIYRSKKRAARAMKAEAAKLPARRSVYDRCNEVLAWASFPSGVYVVGEPWPARKVTSLADYTDEAEVEIITGERK